MSKEYLTTHNVVQNDIFSTKMARISAIVGFTISGVAFVVGTGIEIASGYYTGEFLTFGETSAAGILIGRGIGYGIEVVKTIIYLVARAEMRTSFISGFMRGLCGLFLMVFSCGCTVLYFNHGSDDLIKRHNDAQKAKHERDVRINVALSAIEKFDSNSDKLDDAYNDMVQRGKDTPVINSMQDRERQRDILLEKYNSALAEPCTNIPAIGGKNEIIEKVVSASGWRVEIVRTIVNMGIAIAIEIVIFIALDVCGVGEIINRHFQRHNVKKEEKEELSFSYIKKECLSSANEPLPTSKTPLSRLKKFFEINSNVLTTYSRRGDDVPLTCDVRHEDVLTTLVGMPGRHPRYVEILTHIRAQKINTPGWVCGVYRVAAEKGMGDKTVSKIFSQAIEDGFIDGTNNQPTKRLFI